MKSRLLFLSLGFLFMLTACQKDSIIPIDEEIISDPVLVENPLIKGILVDKNEPLGGVDIDVYQLEKKVATVTTKSDGSFSTQGIKFEGKHHITFSAEKTGYIPLAKRVNSENATIKMKLLGAENSLTKVEPFENPGSNDLIKISGKVLSPTGVALSDVDVAVFYNIVQNTPSSWSADGGIVKTDEEGNYELLVKKNIELNYYVAQNHPCKIKVLSQNESFLFNGIFPVELIGPFNDDVVLPTINNGLDNILDVPYNVKINIIAKSCNGFNISLGKLTYNITIGSFSTTWEGSIIGGLNLATEFRTCIPSSEVNKPITITTQLVDNANLNTATSAITIPFTNTIDLGELIACTPPPPTINRFSFTIGNQLYEESFEPGGNLKPVLSNSTLYVPNMASSTLDFLSFEVPNIIPNTPIFNSKITNFSYKPFPNIYKQESENIDVTVSTVGNYYSGSFKGKIKNLVTNEVEDILGSFIVVIE